MRGLSPLTLALGLLACLLFACGSPRTTRSPMPTPPRRSPIPVDTGRVGTPPQAIPFRIDPALDSLLQAIRAETRRRQMPRLALGWRRV